MFKGDAQIFVLNSCLEGVNFTDARACVKDQLRRGGSGEPALGKAGPV